MAVVGDLGGNPITLENAAEEATLQRLVDLFENKFADNSGVKKKEAEAIKAATKETKSYQDIVDSTSKGMEKYEVKLTTFGDRLGKTTDALKNVGSSLTNSFKQLGDGGENLGSALQGLGNSAGGALSKLGIAGKLAGGALIGLTGIVGMAFGAFDKQIKMFQTLTASGATFGGDMIAMRNAAATAGVTLEQYSSAVSKSAKGLSQFAGSTTQGAMILSNVVKAGKASSNELFRLGIAAKDQPEFFAQFIEDLAVSGRNFDDFGRDFSRIAKVAVKYRQDLQVLSEITGQSAEDQKAAAQALKTDAAFQSILNGLNKDQIDSTNALLRTMTPLEQQMFKQQMVLGTFTGEAAIAASQFPGVTGRIMDVTNALKNGETDLVKTFAASSQARSQQLSKDAELAREQAKQGVFTTNSLTQLAEKLAIALTVQDKQNSTALETLEQQRARLAEEKPLTDAAATRAEAMQKIQVAFEKLGTALVDSGIIEKISKAMPAIASRFDDFATFIKDFKFDDFISKISNSLSKSISENLPTLFLGAAATAAIGVGISGLIGKIGGAITTAMVGGGSKAGSGVASLATKATAKAGGGMAGLATKATTKAGSGGLSAAMAAPLKALGNALAAVGIKSVPILAGAGVIAGVITAIGGGIAAASWLTGTAMPTLTKGLEGIQNLDGDALSNSAKGLALVSAAMAVMGGGSAAAGIGSLIGKITSGGKNPADMLEDMASGVNEFANAIDKLDLAKMTMLAGFVVPGAGDLAGMVQDATSGDTATTTGTASTETTTSSSEHTALLQRLLDIQTRQGTETNDLLRRISNDI